MCEIITVKTVETDKMFLLPIYYFIDISAIYLSGNGRVRFAMYCSVRFQRVIEYAFTRTILV